MAIQNYAFLRNWFSWWPWNSERGEQREGPRSNANEADVTLTEERKLQISAVFSCIRLLTEAIGSLSLGVYERQEKGRKSADTHRVAKLLMEPNPLMTGQQYLEALAMQLVGWGNSYSLTARNDAGDPVFLWPLTPASMKVERVKFDQVVYKYTHHEGATDYRPEQILHCKGFGPDGIVGLSPLAFGAQTLGLTVAGEKYSSAFFKNGGRPSGVLTVDKPMTPAQREQLRSKYSELTGGEGNGLYVLDALAKYQPISISPEDAQLLVSRQFQVGEIARIFRVPLFLLMEMEKSTSWGTGLEQQNIAFLTYTLRPYLTRIESAMNRALFSEAERGKFYVEFNVESLLRGDSKARAEFYASMVQNGLMSRNEVRQKENMVGYDGGDIYTAQTNLAPVDKLGELAEAAAKKPEPKVPNGSENKRPA